MTGRSRDARTPRGLVRRANHDAPLRTEEETNVFIYDLSETLPLFCLLENLDQATWPPSGGSQRACTAPPVAGARSHSAATIPMYKAA